MSYDWEHEYGLAIARAERAEAEIERLFGVILDVEIDICAQEYGDAHARIADAVGPAPRDFAPRLYGEPALRPTSASTPPDDTRT